MLKRKKTKKENYNNINANVDNASHLTTDKAQSYSEVSFDVLENAVEKRNRVFGYKSKNFKNRAIISSEEMLNNKNSKNNKKKESSVAKPRLGKLAIFITIMLVIFALLFLLFYSFNNVLFDVRDYKSHPLKAKIIEISKYDDEIFKLNALLQSPLNDQKIKQADINKEKFEKTKDSLNEINDDVSDIASEMSIKDEDYVYVSYVKQSIEARILMIESGLKIYENAKSSLSIIAQTEEFWNTISNADSALKESDVLVESNSEENFKLAKESSEKAVNLLIQAKEQVAKLDASTQAYDFTIYNKYIDARLDSARCSVEACDALITQNVDTIAALNFAYIEKSNAASDIAMTISTTPVQVLRTDYDLQTRPLIDEFKAARLSAAENDYTLRSYLISK